MSGGGSLRDKENASLFVDTDGHTKRRIAGSFTADPAVEWTFTDATTSGAYTYYGFQKPDNEWEIKRIDTPLTQMRIANITNNPTQTTYDLAWSNVLILTYEKLGDI